MRTTVRTPPTEPDTPHVRTPLGRIWINVALAAIVVVLASTVVFLSSSSDDDATVPDRVQKLLDEFLAASEDDDIAAVRGLVTDDFHRRTYVDPFGTTAIRADQTIGDLEVAAASKIEQVGDRIVRGDGPWFVSVAENLSVVAVHGDDSDQLRYEAIVTYTVVVGPDDDMRIDDISWVGQQVPTTD